MMSWPEQCVVWVGATRAGQIARRVLDAPLSLSIVATLAGLTVLLRLNEVLHAMHPPAADGARFSILSDVGFDIPTESDAINGVETWRRFDGIAPSYTSPSDVAHTYLLVDLGFALILSILTAAVLLRLLRMLRNASVTALSNAERWVVSFALLLVPAYLIADWSEGIFSWLVLDDLWSDLRPRATGETRPDLGSVWFWPAAVASIAKWVFFTLAAIPALIAALTSIGTGDARRWFDAFVTVRAQVLFAGLLAGGLLFDPTGQVGDAILRWLDDPWHAVAAIAGMAWFSVVSFAVAWHLFGWPRPASAAGTAPPLPGEVARVSVRWWLLLGAMAAAAIAAAVAGLYFSEKADAGEGLYAFAIVIGGVVLFSIPVRELESADPPTVAFARSLLAPIIAVIPLVVLGLAIVRSALPAAAATGEWGAIALVGMGLALQGVTVAVFIALRRRAARKHWGNVFDPAQRRVRLGLTLLVLALTCVGSVVVVVELFRLEFDDFVDVTRALGAIGVLAVFLSIVGLLAFLLALASEALRPAPVFALLRLRRTPVFVLLLLWAALATPIDKDGAFHDARLRPSTAAWTPQTASGAIERWLGRIQTWRGERRAVPLVLVAAEGGGIRAAYWTALVLRCIAEERIPCEDVDRARPPHAAWFAMSGVSGGSLGLATYAAHRISVLEGNSMVEGKPVDWLATLEADTLSPTLAWALFVDVPVSFVRKDGGTDRAEVLERAWEGAWPQALSPLEQGFLRTGARPSIPFLLLNGTKVQDGCRFNNSILDLGVEGEPSRAPSERRLVDDCLALRLFERDTAERFSVEAADREAWTLGATEDLVDYVCVDKDRRQDVRLSTAALLSARFPLISPSGRIVRCVTDRGTGRDNDDGGDEDQERAINVVDGGYFDTSASSTALELWAAVSERVHAFNRTREKSGQPCVVPMLLQVDNHYADVRGQPTSRPAEMDVPLRTLRTGRTSREAQARQLAALLFSRSLPAVKRVFVREKDGSGNETTLEVERFAHVYPRAHPGTAAPLGWTLSEAARADLRRELEESNRSELAKVRRWFDLSLECE
jgi:hypothetical protein